ncbi:dihydroorotase [Psychrobacter sp. FDAARGOS_221]|uniref:dihydroorotase n=1 Tax=Psychrobacter sp. FDAARGOS_221 TaxID=1975705 RepID=UPI000BB530E6|nr:dihydroorotase [Psychrobacter sp. FDAARGOS_221]PNK61802.1 dihydroorotase [Psychrobacter sp. FDAARGOS_221]
MTETTLNHTNNDNTDTSLDNNSAAQREITLTRPDDWHIHLRDAEALPTTVAHAAEHFNRVICMPNLVPPVVNVDDAIAYRGRILDELQRANIKEEYKASFNPRMTLYLTDTTSAEDIKLAAESGIVQAVKLYPAGATTNSSDGVTNLAARTDVFDAMQKYGLPLLIHGEVTESHVDIFDREKQFIDTTLTHMVNQFPELKIVVEHITTGDAADFVLSQSERVAATITPQHLLFNRNHLLVGGVKPHFYCLPILKRRQHQEVLLDVATSGNPKFFLGTDSAPHATHAKENACGCAGCYSASIALPLYATAFDSVGKIDRLEGFASQFGAKFYGLPVNKETVTLVNTPMQVPASYPYMQQQSLTPLMAGETLPWSLKQD